MWYSRFGWGRAPLNALPFLRVIGLAIAVDTATCPGRSRKNLGTSPPVSLGGPHGFTDERNDRRARGFSSGNPLTPRSRTGKKYCEAAKTSMQERALPWLKTLTNTKKI